MKISVDGWENFISSLNRADKLQERQQVLISSYGGGKSDSASTSSTEGQIHNKVEGCSTTNNCKGANCAVGCSS